MIETKDKIKSPKVEIIILNWNGWKDTLECLESVYRINYPNYEVIVVDNGSENESIEKIREYCRGEIVIKSKLLPDIADPCKKPIIIIEFTKEELDLDNAKNDKIEALFPNRKLILIKNDKNYGFAEGNNIAIKYALNALNSDYLLLLNNDTVVDKELLWESIKVAETDKKIGIIGPKIYYYDFRGRTDVINLAGGVINLWRGQTYRIGVNEIDKGQYDEIRKVDYVEGSSLLIKKQVIDKIGLIDSSYFAYWEEIDFCMRGSKVGYWSMYVPKARIWHKISSSVESSQKIYFLTRNRFLFTKKFSTNSQYVSFLFYFFGFQFWSICYTYLTAHKIQNLKYFFKGTLDGIRIKRNI
jgi:GT2 family glycosyltransferase